MNDPELASLSYGELLDHLRKDLLLDARTDIAPGTVLASLIDQNGQTAFPQLVVPANAKVQWGNSLASFNYSNGATPSLTGPVGLSYLGGKDWSNNHFAIVASFVPGPFWPTFTAVNPDGLGLDAYIACNGTAGASGTGTFRMNWISLGN